MPIRPKAECCQRFKLTSGRKFSQPNLVTGSQSTMAFFAEFNQISVIENWKSIASCKNWAKGSQWKDGSIVKREEINKGD
jgi:hypothetical protein